MSRKVKPWIVACFLLPGLILYVYFFFIPMVESFYISLTEWDGFSSSKIFVGLKNYKDLTTDPNFKVAFGNTLAFMIFGGIFVFILTLLFAYLLTKKKFKGRKFFSNLFYFPNMISQAALAVLWVFVFNPNFGLLNNVLTAVGLKKLIIVWLGGRVSGMACIIFATSISFVGFYLILVLAGYDRIPKTYLEAAEIDGASDVYIYFKITLPMMSDVLVICAVLWVINSIKYFELIWAMFKGANTQLNTLGTYMYSVAFGVATPIFKLGYGSAIAVVMFLMVVVFAGVIRAIFERRSLQY